MSQLTVRESIDEMVALIVERFDPDRIILFGSHARGTANIDSDIDLLIVMPTNGSKRKKAVEIDLALVEMGVPKDVLVVSPEEADSYQDTVGTIVYTALHEEQLLYERAA